MRVLHAIHDFLPLTPGGSRSTRTTLPRDGRAHDVWILAAEYDPSTAPRHAPVAHPGRADDHRTGQQLGVRSVCRFVSVPEGECAACHVLDATLPDVLHVHNLLEPVVRTCHASHTSGASGSLRRCTTTLALRIRADSACMSRSRTCATMIDSRTLQPVLRGSPFPPQMGAARLMRALAVAGSASRHLDAQARTDGRCHDPSKAASAAPATPPICDSARVCARAFDHRGSLRCPLRAIAEEFERFGVHPGGSRYRLRVPRLAVRRRSPTDIASPHWLCRHLVWHKDCTCCSSRSFADRRVRNPTCTVQQPRPGRITERLRAGAEGAPRDVP